MATLKNGLLGGFSGKVGNYVGSSCRGVDYIKSLPVKMTNPRTKGQTKQRSNFIITQSFLRTFTPFIRIGFKDHAVDGKSAFNAAMSYNMMNSVKNGTDAREIDFSKVLISRGSLYCSTTINASVTDNHLHFEWDPVLNENAKSTDQVMILAYNSTRAEAVYDINAGKRKNASSYIDLPAGWNGDIIETYIAFKNEEGTLVSDSSYTGQFTI